GKTSKGMILHGKELDIRSYVLENCYDVLYGDYPLDADVKELISAELRQKAFEKQVGRQFVRYLILMMDRFLTGHYIGKLTDAYYNLTANGEFYRVNEMLDRIGGILHVDFPVEEKIFAFLPIAGMRTPADLGSVQEMELDEAIGPLSEKIMARIREELDISIDPRDFAEEFSYHLMFMLNRLRFKIRQPNAILEELRAKFPLAYEMSGIAARVIEEEQGLKVNQDERGHLASYFGVFLEENNLGQRRPFRIAVICGTGRVTARLISVQLKKIVDSQVQIKTMSDTAASPELLETYDVILSTVELPFRSPKPVIRIREIFDEKELKQKLEKARYWDRVDIPVLDDNQFIMSSLLDENKVFFFEKGRSYTDALDEMTEILTDEDYIDQGFGKRLSEREEKGTMVFDNGVAIPHGIQTANDRMLLAMGIFEEPAPYKGQKVRIIFYMALPEESDADDMLMIRVYDELLEISRNTAMLDAISKTRNYQELLRILYKK
ncbi:MAG: PTS sugar transporter subunit IIA, partial [Lachnospiraceae bacterium]|nr:PTS sugar transporter subunit IIA [Lachnospiraceae bacterium]